LQASCCNSVGMEHRLDTQLIHTGEPRPRVGGAINLPIYQSVNYEYAGEDDYHKLIYLRLNNTPNHQALHTKLAALEGCEDALVTASGMAAISAALLGVLKHGDHVLAHNCLYGGTHTLLTHDLPEFGISHSFVDASKPDTWGACLQPSTRVFYVESLTNPLLETGELEEVCRFCRQHGLLAVIDNTLTSPINFRPRELGYDLVLHSATKYLNGHSDIAAGVVLGTAETVRQIRHRWNHLGGCLDPNSCYLLHRGLKTLGVRVREQNRTAQLLAEWLQAQAGIKRVNYAGLPGHPGHERAKRWFAGFGGVLSFELEGNVDSAERFLSKLHLPLQAPSLGGVESLVTRPVRTSHAGMSEEQWKSAGITPNLIRFSVGLEDFEDLRDDLAQALS
jgi:cystathionine beta-lyase/cystathionine gamma-synthase